MEGRSLSTAGMKDAGASDRRCSTDVGVGFLATVSMARIIDFSWQLCHTPTPRIYIDAVKQTMDLLLVSFDITGG